MSKHYQIRFNTKAKPGAKLVWRVFEDGVQRLARGIDINVPSYTETSWEGTEKKFNIACDGYGVWDGDWLEVRPE